MNNNRIKDILWYYYSNPRTNSEIEELRSEATEIVNTNIMTKCIPNEINKCLHLCKINLSQVKQIIDLLLSRLFLENGLLRGKTIHDIFGEINYSINNKIPALALFDTKTYTISINCTFINTMYELLQQFDKLNIKLQNNNKKDEIQYKSNNINRTLVLLLEHELTHLLITTFLVNTNTNKTMKYIFLPQTQGSGPNVKIIKYSHDEFFIHFIKNIFGHTWADFAIIAIPLYIEVYGDRDEFFTKLIDEHNFDINYATNVFEILNKHNTQLQHLFLVENVRSVEKIDRDNTSNKSNTLFDYFGNIYNYCTGTQCNSTKKTNGGKRKTKKNPKKWKKFKK